LFINIFPTTHNYCLVFWAGGGKALFFFKNGWVSTFKYLFLAVGATRDAWIYPFFNIGSRFMFEGLEFKVYGVVGAFHLMLLMLYNWEGSHFCFFFFSLMSFESFKSSISFWNDKQFECFYGFGNPNSFFFLKVHFTCHLWNSFITSWLKLL